MLGGGRIMGISSCYVFFFFSSRRRHTRSLRDWSQTCALPIFMGIPGDPITFDVQQAWRPRPKRDRYRIPFGIGEHGQAVELDIKEAAEDGMGPHGLCIGEIGRASCRERV